MRRVRTHPAVRCVSQAYLLLRDAVDREGATSRHCREVQSDKNCEASVSMTRFRGVTDALLEMTVSCEAST